jgi:hypothetical protein
VYGTQYTTVLQKNNIVLEKYIKLKHDKMYIDEAAITLLDRYEIVTPFMYYSTFNYDFCNINITDVFYFTDEVKLVGGSLNADSGRDEGKIADDEVKNE